MAGQQAAAWRLPGKRRAFELRTIRGNRIYQNQATRAATSNHYRTLPVDEICNEPIRQLAADAAHLHLWTTNAFLLDAFDVMEAWGFEYKSCFVWVKPQTDWTLKPAGQVFIDLVRRQWWTDESLVTDDGGECRLRAFLGRYRVNVEHEGRQSVTELSLSREGGQITAVLPKSAAPLSATAHTP